MEKADVSNFLRKKLGLVGATNEVIPLQPEFLQEESMDEVSGDFVNELYRCVFNCILILLPRESDQSAMTSSLRSCRPSVYHSKMREFR